MVDVVTEINIEVPIEVAFEYASNPERAPEWYDNIDSATWITGNEVSVGSKIKFTARFMGKTLVYTYEIMELVQNQRLVMSTSKGPFPMETTYELNAIDETNTRLVLRNRGYPKGFSKLMSPLMVPAMRRANRKDLQKLKTILENR